MDNISITYGIAPGVWKDPDSPGRFVYEDNSAAFFFYMQTHANGSQFDPPLPFFADGPNCNVNETDAYIKSLWYCQKFRPV